MERPQNPLPAAPPLAVGVGGVTVGLVLEEAGAVGDPVADAPFCT